MRDLPPEERPSTTWTPSQFKEMEAKVQRRRDKQIVDDRGASAKPPALRKGRYGAINHFRHGLAGAVRLWARGSRRNVVRLLRKLVALFGVEEEMRAHLFQRVRREAETDRLIVDRLVEALQVLKGCQTEQQRCDYLLALSLVVPHRSSQRDQAGAARRVSARLRVARGKRSKKRGERRHLCGPGRPMGSLGAPPLLQLKTTHASKRWPLLLR